jgi:hypothetical protein
MYIYEDGWDISKANYKCKIEYEMGPRFMASALSWFNSLNWLVIAIQL